MIRVQIIIGLIIFKALLASTYYIRKANTTNSHNPGPCNADNHGYLQIVKDREMKDKLLICTEEKGVFRWTVSDGSNLPGEFFNPGFDCSNILDKSAQPKDGFYWVKFFGEVPRKVWCDMSTDEGGYILIGRKTSPETWSVPSNDTPVDPYGSPHWLSSIGDAPVLDFRIQVSTSENPQRPVSHWAYRLKQPRLLKNLIVEGEKVGCGWRSPGIGNVAYVKDLMVDKIVTTNFRCSKFGGYRPSYSKAGWRRMNECLNIPCPNGFAFHHEHGFQNDYSGSFSYSVSQSKSGVSHDSTAYIGCNHGVCCECHGPPGGTENYCGDDCTAKNGGQIEFGKVYTWYWVRPSLPKKVWNKCMEYKTIGNQGEIEWFKLIGQSNTPIKGNCPKDGALMNKGIVVVPDDETAKKVPAVPGLLQYRKDNKKLYVRSNETWKVIAPEKKVNRILKSDVAQLKTELQSNITQLKTKDTQLNGDIAEMQRVIENLNDTVNNLLSIVKDPRLFSESVILSGYYGHTFISWIGGSFTAKLCWRATRDGWSASTFHSNCNNKKPTVTIVKVGQYIFGGYATESWEGSSSKQAPGSFIFSLRNKENLPPFKAPLKDQNDGHAIHPKPSYGPILGGGHDIEISDSAASNTGSYTNFDYSYQPPSGVSSTSTILAGSYSFSPSEVEVFYLV